MAPGRPGRVVVVGDVMTDVVVAVDDPIEAGGDTPARTLVRPGGAGANVAHWLARLGTTVEFHGAVGDDAFGREAERVLRDAGVATALRVDAALPTGTCVVIVDRDAERTMLPDQGANALVAAPPPVRGAVHLHVSGYVLHDPAGRDRAAGALRAWAAAGAGTSVDAASAAPLRAMGGAAFLAAVAGTGLLVVTPDEADALVGTRDAGPAVDRLLEVCPEVVLKRGRLGALHATRDGARTSVAAAAPPGPVVDATGAGDAFMAGLLHARLAGAGPRDALTAAVACGARAVTLRGARPGPDGR